jgi:hypothetical protein
MPVRTVLQLPLQVESILSGFVSKVILLKLKLWHLVSGLYVGLLSPNIFLMQNITNSKFTFPAGSSSRLLTLSGVSSKDVAATGRRSG